MTMSLSGPFLIAILGFLGVQVVQIVMIARWTGRIQALTESHATEIAVLRQARHDHGNRVVALETRMDDIQAGIGDAARRRRDD